jgi:hypothetical protein
VKARTKIVAALACAISQCLAWQLMGHGQAVHEKCNTAYVLERAPTYLLIGAHRLFPTPDDPSRQVTPYHPAERELLGSPEFRSRYRVRQGKAASGYFVFFERI